MVHKKHRPISSAMRLAQRWRTIPAIQGELSIRRERTTRQAGCELNIKQKKRTRVRGIRPLFAVRFVASERALPS